MFIQNQEDQLPKTLSNNSKNPNNEEKRSPWSEFKLEGKRNESRSYASLSLYKNKIYVYGGYQLTLGVLNTFYSLDLLASQFSWTQIKAPNSPGHMTRHSAFVCDDNLYIQGGLQANQKQNNKTFKFDLINERWSCLSINDTYPQKGFDNHALVFMQDKRKAAIFGGYFAGQWNDILYFYDVDSNKWEKKEYQKQQNHPSGREGCCLAYLEGKVFLFGGTDGINRFNDLWSWFDGVWTLITTKKAINPIVRNGASLDTFQDKLILFGGIHDITWELDDLWVFKQEWIQTEEESARKIHDSSKILESTYELRLNKSVERVEEKSSSPNKSIQNRSTLQKFNLQPRKSISKSPEIIQIQTKSLKQQRFKTLEDQRKKEMQLQKMNMLKLFEVPEEKQTELRSLSPMSETMRNALLMIGESNLNKQKQQKLTDFGKESFSKFLLPLNNQCNMLYGKRPCARDGHRSVIYKNQLLIFGGDRHQMSFNDLYSFDLRYLLL